MTDRLTGALTLRMHRALLILFALLSTTLAFGAERYQPTEASLATHPLPQWYDDAKLGIFVHWGLYSVPGYATLETVGFDKAHDKDRFQWFKNNAYAEWYYNTLRIDGSPTQAFHTKTYGKDFNYYSFAAEFDRESQKWDPAAWIRLFKDTGARYVVLTSKHHDGFALWPTQALNPHLPADERHSTRDIVGDLTRAARVGGLRVGFYYSSVYDWSFLPGPIRSSADARKLRNEQTPQYTRYAAAQLEELISRYDPDIVWSDIGYPPNGDPMAIIADFYNRRPDGVTNDRWKPFKLGDFTTPEYRVMNEVTSKKWEECRGLGRSFGINRLEGERETISASDLVHQFVDIVSKNGNLLLDVGPEPDGSIPPLQIDRLQKLGTWVKQNGEAIFATRPWTRAEGATVEGQEVRFTHKGEVLYAVLLQRPSGKSVTLRDVPVPAHGHAALLGSAEALSTKHQGGDLRVSLPEQLPGDYAWVIRLD